jgi:hypothetical protein
MALQIAGCCGRAFEACDDAEYRGLVARVVFKEVRMREGNIVSAVLRAPLEFFRRWAGEKPLGNLADLFLISPPDEPLMDGFTKRPLRPIPLSKIKEEDLFQFQTLLTPEEEAEIESCYHELRGRGILTPQSLITKQI